MLEHDPELAERLAVPGGVARVWAARYGSAPSLAESAYRYSGSCGCTVRLTVAIPNGANGIR